METHQCEFKIVKIDVSKDSLILRIALVPVLAASPEAIQNVVINGFPVENLSSDKIVRYLHVHLGDGAPLNSRFKEWFGDCAQPVDMTTVPHIFIELLYSTRNTAFNASIDDIVGSIAVTASLTFLE